MGVDIKRGQVIANRFVIKDLVGRGGMGRIFRADDNVLNEEIALKTLLPQYVQDQMILDRFLNEARIARQLSHPNIVRVHDIGNQDGVVYISMEMLQGRSLREMLDRLPAGQRIPVHAVLRIFDALCAALDYAHRYTIHRDIKPENVMILKDGSVKLMDFGISKLKSNPKLTSASMVMGTPHYMSPEQLKDSSKVDGRADVYSMGVMLYEVLVGQTPTAMPRAASETSPRVPPALDPIIAKCVDPDPDNRYQTAGDLRDALRAVRIQIETKQNVGGAKKENWEVSSHGAAAAGHNGRRRLIGAALLAAVLAATAGGLYKADQRRQARIAEAARPQDPGTETMQTTDIERAWLRHVLGKASEAAVRAAAEFPEPLQPIAAAIAQTGSEWETRAAQSRDTPAEMTNGLNALSCFWALTDWRENMMFVPPDETAPGFFIQIAPVTSEAYSEFAVNTGAPFKATRAGDPSAPASNLTAYEAIAYLAAQTPPMQLPSESQWTRAFQYAESNEAVALMRDGADETNEAESEPAIVFVVRDDFGEWTETSAEGGNAAFIFGQRLVVWNATRKESFPYEQKTNSLGFRGVVNMPRDWRKLDRIFLP